MTSFTAPETTVMLLNSIIEKMSDTTFALKIIGEKLIHENKISEGAGVRGLSCLIKDLALELDAELGFLIENYNQTEE